MSLQRLNESTLAVGIPKSEGTKRNKAEKYWMQKITREMAQYGDAAAAEIWERMVDGEFDGLDVIRQKREAGHPRSDFDGVVDGRLLQIVETAEWVAAERNYIEGI